MTEARGSELDGDGDLRALYERRIVALRDAFQRTGDGVAACRARTEAVDALIRALWSRIGALHPAPTAGIALVALGGYGRGQLFPFSDIDLLFLTEKTASGAEKEAIREVSQGLWDCGLKVSPVTRSLGECERYKPSDPEFSLALLDLRPLGGSPTLFEALRSKILDRRTVRESRTLAAATAALTRERHARFGNTLFHLEPNLKDAPGGLRDANVCRWLAHLRGDPGATQETAAFTEAVQFLTAARVFLHLRHGRDDNTLDWHAQDEAAAAAVGLGPNAAARSPRDPAYWMRAYFRHARAVERRLRRELDNSGEQPKPTRAMLRVKAPPRSGFFLKDGVLDLKIPGPQLDPAADPEIVLGAFALIAEAGLRLAPESEERIAAALPALSGALEDGPRLWSWLRPVLTGRHAAAALREMHALGVLELILPEFHGIDALVIRDAYHRYTVDEHTFVLIDVLHGLDDEPPTGAPHWRHRFRSTLRELPVPELLFLAALLHDTGKGRTSVNHPAASAGLAASVCARLELGPHETDLVLRLIELHLEMSAALRRDIFDGESVRVFAERAATHDLLRMLTLFTYADISAVHPDALTPWKAENLWRLSMAAANQLDRSVDQDRVDTHAAGGPREIDSLLRALGRSAPDRPVMEQFLDGFPERYLRTRSPEAIRQHLLMSAGTVRSVALAKSRGMDELTVVTRDRPQLFADLAAVLAGWGMEVVTAEAFSNAAGVVVDTFCFHDTYRTLQLNPEEVERFRGELEAVATGSASAAPGTRRRGAPRPPLRRDIETRIEFDNTVSTHSTLLQIVTRDLPGLLQAAARVLSDFRCGVEVALIDTEGEVAIDVFYITRSGQKLSPSESDELRERMGAAIAANEGA